MDSTFILFQVFKSEVQNEYEPSLSPEITTPDNKICRICLKEGCIPIFGDDGNGNHDISEDIITFADIELSKYDDFPKYTCQSCHDLLQAAILLRITAKASDIYLKTTCLKNEIGEQPVISKGAIKESKESLKNEIQEQPETSTDALQESKNIIPELTLLDEFLLSDDDLSLPKENSEPVQTKNANKVECKICSKMITKSYYKQHYKLHDLNDNKFICDVCGKTFRLKSTYKKHCLTHSSNFPFKCELCPYQGRNAGLLSNHMLTHTKVYKYFCSECPSKFLSKTNLNRHFLKHKEPEFKCDMCQKLFHTKIVLEKHMEVIHLGIKRFVCTICGKAFGFRKGLMRHELEIHNRKKKMKGRTPSYIVAEFNENKTECENNLSLSNEISESVHPEKKNRVECKICSKMITKSYYKQHYRLHNPKTLLDNKFICDVCGKSFRLKSTYKKHLTTHNSNFPFKCELCPYRGRNSSLLSHHMLSHSKDYQYLCSECPAKFPTRTNLNRHTLKHKNPEFKCDNCQKRFHKKIALEKHIEVKHLGIRSFACETCAKTFGFRKGLLRHELEVHKREKKRKGRIPAYLQVELEKNNMTT